MTAVEKLHSHNERNRLNKTTEIVPVELSESFR